MKRTTFFISITLIFSMISLQITHAQVVFQHGDGVLSVAFSPVDDTLLASGSSDGTVKLWDVEAQTDVATLEGHAIAIASIAFSPNGILLASGSYDGAVKLWNVNTHSNIATLEGHAVPVTSVAFSPDGGTLASGAGDGRVKLWDVATHQNTATFGGYDAFVLEGGGWHTPVSFLSNTTLAVSALNSVKLWDVEAEENIVTFEVLEDVVVSVSCSPDGTTVAAGLVSGVIKLWDVATGTNTATFPLPSQYFLPLPAFQFSPDGTQIAATLDESVALWDIETSTQINTLFGHTEAVRSVSFSSDGTLASGALDGTVRLWNPSLPGVLQETQPQETLVASTAFPLTEANLHGNIVTLTLNGQQFVDEEWAIEYEISVSGIEGVAVSSSFSPVSRMSDTEVTVELEFDGTDFDTDAALAFIVGSDAIVDSNGQGIIALIPVTAIQKSDATVSVSPSPVISPAIGEELTFSLNIEGGENVAGYQATLWFDPTALYPVDITNGDYLPADVFIADQVASENLIDTAILYDEEL
ncbi:hypothetical protein F4Y93_13305, partial [Candidatus Poribacteria bacterium]|nr:hypothetical protein [Candidatus Poribacteria bacterium]